MKKLLLSTIIIFNTVQITANVGMNLEDADAVFNDIEFAAVFLTAIKRCAIDINSINPLNNERDCLTVAQILMTEIMNINSTNDSRRKTEKMNRLAESYSEIMKNYSKLSK